MKSVEREVVFSVDGVMQAMRHDRSEAASVRGEEQLFTSWELVGMSLPVGDREARANSLTDRMSAGSVAEASLPNLAIVDGNGPCVVEEDPLSGSGGSVVQDRSFDYPDARDWAPPGVLLVPSRSGVRDVCSNPDAADWTPDGLCQR